MPSRSAVTGITALVASAVLALGVGGRSNAQAIANTYPVRGMYDRDLSASGFDDLARRGFNFIDSSPNSHDVRPLTSRGLKALVWLGGYEPSTCKFRRSDEWVRARVIAIRQSRGVGAYFIADEPNAAECPSAPAQVRRRSRLVKSLDPKRPTFIVVHRIEQLPKFAHAVDVIGPDDYACKIKLNGCDYSIIRREAALADKLRIR
jgi:hypothetical protein